MAIPLVREAAVETVYSHHTCSALVPVGGLVYPARLRAGDVYCSPLCRNRAARCLVQKRRRQDPLKYQRDKDKKIERKYGIPIGEWQRMYDGQMGRCAICFDPFSETQPYVDHDHETGAVRGLLCGRCNLVLGQIGDHIPLLRNAIEYLTEAAEAHRLNAGKGV
jgi:hypothetical protein